MYKIQDNYEVFFSNPLQLLKKYGSTFQIHNMNNKISNKQMDFQSILVRSFSNYGTTY